MHLDLTAVNLAKLDHKALSVAAVAAVVSYIAAKQWPLGKGFDHIPMSPMKSKGLIPWLLGHPYDEMVNAYGDIRGFYANCHAVDPFKRVGRFRVVRKNWIAVCHPADIQHIHTEIKYIKTDAFKILLGRLLRDGVVCQLDEVANAAHKKKMVPAFSPGALKHITNSIIPTHLMTLVETLREHTKHGKKVVVQDDIYTATVRIMADSIFKTKTLEDTKALVSALTKAILGQWCWLRMIPGMEHLLFSKNRDVDAGRAYCADRARAIMKEQLASGEVPSETTTTAIIDYLIYGGFDEEHVIDHSVNFMFAAQDTTSQAMAFVTCLLAQKPEAQAKLFEELSSAIGPNKPCTLDDIKNCTYLHLCLKEVLRVRQGIGISSRVATEDDVLPATKTFVPKGTNIITNYWTPMHHPDIWGPDAEEFRPERWDELTPEQEDWVQLSYIPFSSGRRNCVGKPFALNTVTILSAVLFRNFEFVWPSDEPEPVLIQTGALRNRDPIHLIVKERE